MPYLLHDPAAATTPARDRGPGPEPASSNPARPPAEGADSARPRRPAARQGRPAVTGTPHQAGAGEPARTPGPDHRDDPPARTEAEAAATAIAGLRRRLARQSTLDHPAVRRELRHLEQQLTTQLDRAARQPGRHRFPAGRPGPRHGEDTGQPGPSPDPATARTAAELITMLGQYKTRSGNPSWRTIAARSGQTIGHATIQAALHGTALPSLSLVTAVITGCGGSQDEVTAFTSAWQHITTASTTGNATPPGHQAAPAPALQPLPGT